MRRLIHVSEYIREQPLRRNVQRFRGGPVFKADRLCVSLNSRLDSNEEEEVVDFLVQTLEPLVAGRSLHMVVGN